MQAALLVAGAVTASMAGASSVSGVLSLVRENRMDHELYGLEEKDMAAFIDKNVPPKSVILHNNNHRALSGMLNGLPSLVAYDGWAWSHGYNYGSRHNDRNIALDHLIKDSDKPNYERLRRWGVRYVLAENPRVWPSKKKGQEGGDKDLFLDGNLKRIHVSGRFHLFEVLGYGFPPS